MTNKLQFALFVAITGLAIHGSIVACGSINSKSPPDASRFDAQANDAPTPSDASAPTGAIVAFGGTTIPSGWALCDGAAVSRSTYATLFAAVGINFGTGDGVSTFNLPDLRGRFIRGVDGGTGRDPDATRRSASGMGSPTGDVVGSLEGYATSLPSTPFLTENSGGHVHTNGIFDRLLSYTRSSTAPGSDNNDSSGSEPDIIHSAVMASAGAHVHRLGGGFGAGGDKETRPLNIAVSFIIKL